MLIVPSILTNDLNVAKEVLEKISEVVLPHGFPLERVQIDINDGTFLGERTIEPQELGGFESNLKIDYHLMVNNPSDWIKRCPHALSVIGQIETMPSQENFVDEAKLWGIKAGLAVDFETGVFMLNEGVLKNVSIILLMSYPAGKGGQVLDERIYGKIEEVKSLREKGDYHFKICVDGGITLDNIKNLKLLGVDEVVIGKRIIEGDIEENLEKMYKAMY